MLIAEQGRDKSVMTMYSSSDRGTSIQQSCSMKYMYTYLYVLYLVEVDNTDSSLMVVVVNFR